MKTNFENHSVYEEDRKKLGKFLQKKNELYSNKYKPIIICTIYDECIIIAHIINNRV